MTAPKAKDGCIFCNACEKEPAAETLTVYRDQSSVVMLNRYPYTNGHLMVAPSRHHAKLFESTEQELMSLIRLAALSQRYLSEIYNPDGFNLGMNFGHVAGAGIADHYHLHVVPRWGGDANFMSVTAQTRMIPEQLEVTYEKVRAKFAGS